MHFLQTKLHKTNGLKWFLSRRCGGQPGLSRRGQGVRRAGAAGIPARKTARVAQIHPPSKEHFIALPLVWPTLVWFDRSWVGWQDSAVIGGLFRTLSRVCQERLRTLGMDWFDLAGVGMVRVQAATLATAVDAARSILLAGAPANQVEVRLRFRLLARLQQRLTRQGQRSAGRAGRVLRRRFDSGAGRKRAANVLARRAWGPWLSPGGYGDSPPSGKKYSAVRCHNGA